MSNILTLVSLEGEGLRLHLLFLEVGEALCLVVQKEQILEVVVVDEKQEEDYVVDLVEKVVHLMLPYKISISLFVFRPINTSIIFVKYA